MAKIPSHIIDDIMQTARIEEVVGEFVNLKRAGANLKGLSPFTEEKTPSFVVSPSKQIFKCFKSGKGGKVVTFLMEHKGLSYPEALKWLADKYNIIIPDDNESGTTSNTPQVEKLIVNNDGVYKEFYPGKQNIKLTGLIDTDGKRQGTWEYFSEDGTLLSMMEYRDGVKHGIFFQRYTSGSIKRTGNYKADQQSGEWVDYNEQGIRTTIKQYPS
jgi:DNA primase